MQDIQSLPLRDAWHYSEEASPALEVIDEPPTPNAATPSIGTIHPKTFGAIQIETLLRVPDGHTCAPVTSVDEAVFAAERIPLITLLTRPRRNMPRYVVTRTEAGNCFHRAGCSTLNQTPRSMLKTVRPCMHCRPGEDVSSQSD